jgi:hypothetical protein
MLTILAWIVFVPAIVWAVTFFSIFFSAIINNNKPALRNPRNWRDAALSLALLLIPGVYLFGWF